jgi:hypothetical protein
MRQSTRSKNLMHRAHRDHKLHCKEPPAMRNDTVSRLSKNAVKRGLAVIRTGTSYLYLSILRNPMHRFRVDLERWRVLIRQQRHLWPSQRLSRTSMAIMSVQHQARHPVLRLQYQSTSPQSRHSAPQQQHRHDHAKEELRHRAVH